MKTLRLMLLLGALMGAPVVAAVALPGAVSAVISGPDGALRALGSGEMRWFGLKLYDAALWVPAGQPWSVEGPYALALRYARNIPGERLVDTSIDEIRRLGYTDEAVLARWREALSLALPSVSSGDTLVGVRLAGGGARFWHLDRPTADIDDAELARAFFAIWLDPRTREPALRARLLGEQASGGAGS